MTAEPKKFNSHKRSKQLPKKTKLIKQSLPRPLPPSTLSSEPKTVYVSAKSPFISTVKRVRKALQVFKDQEKLSLSTKDYNSHSRQRNFRHERTAGKPKDGTDVKDKFVSIKGTGKAIEKVLSFALYFQGQKDVTVAIRTGTVECTDDVVMDRRDDTLESLMMAKSETKSRVATGVEQVDVSMDADDTEMKDSELQEDTDREEVDEFEEIEDAFPSRSRNISALEVIVRNKYTG